MTTPIVDATVITHLVNLDREIDANEEAALRGRWEFGQIMLSMRDGMGRLPNGVMTDLVEKTGKSRSELGYRIQFADRYQTEEKLSNALDSFGAWRDLVKSLKLAKDAEDNLPVAPAAPPDGKFSTFVVDPPWQYGNTSTRGAAENHYNTMTIEELCELDVVPKHAAEKAHLYLWVTAGHLPDAFEIIQAWGFDYKTYLVWVKPQMGMGNYFRVSTELVLFGVKGGLRTLDRGIMNWFEIPRGTHSQKPTQFHDLVTRASPGPYMELFCRCWADKGIMCVCSKCRLGWTTWGDQACAA